MQVFSIESSASVEMILADLGRRLILTATCHVQGIAIRSVAEVGEILCIQQGCLIKN